MDISKTMRYVTRAGGVSILAGMPALIAPSIALADGWVNNTLDTAAQQVGKDKAEGPTADSVSELVRSISTWVLGIAIVLFVLKVVLTAIDRMLVSDPSHGDSFLVRLPLIGAYPAPDEYMESERKGYAWKDVWILFFTQLLIAVAAWFIVGFIVGILSSVLQASN